MSSICLLNFDAKDLTFEQLNDLANELVKCALLNCVAVNFNDDKVKEFFNKQKLNTYILLSDSFIYRSADDLLDITSLAHETEENYKIKFIQKYGFFSQLIDIVFNYKIESIDFYVSEQGSINRFINVETQKDSFMNELFSIFIEHSLKTGFTFPDLKIHIVR